MGVSHSWEQCLVATALPERHIYQSNAEHLLQAVDSLALKIDHIFAASTKLDSEAIQHFVKHLSAVAALELHGGGTKSLRGWEVLGDSGSGSGIGSGGAGGRVDGVSNTGFAGTGNLEDGIITTVSNGSTVADPTISTPRVFSLQKLVEANNCGNHEWIEKNKKEWNDAVEHIRFCVLIYWDQMRRGKHFLHENQAWWHRVGLREDAFFS